RMLCMATPGGFEEFFLEVERTGASEPAELEAIARKYRLEFVKPTLPAPMQGDTYEDALSG
ncbi:MAG: hypothetical protein ACTHLT_20960, partial [Devosia sp.]